MVYLGKLFKAFTFWIFSGEGGSGMTPSSKCYDLIKRFEGCRLEAYQDSVGVWTIGWGTTRYPDGSPVSPGDKITQAEADYYLEYEV
jgi:lysozyme